LVGERDFPLFQSVQTSSGPISLMFSEYTGTPTPVGSVVKLATASSAPTTVYRHGVYKGDFTFMLPTAVIVVVVVVVTVTTV
jgi:hypothetical protein